MLCHVKSWQNVMSCYTMTCYTMTWHDITKYEIETNNNEIEINNTKIVELEKELEKLHLMQNSHFQNSVYLNKTKEEQIQFLKEMKEKFVDKFTEIFNSWF